MTRMFLFRGDLPLRVAMVTVNGRQNRLKKKKYYFGPKFGGLTDKFA